MLDAQQTAAAVGEGMWADDDASKALGMALIAISPGRAEISMTVRADMINGYGVCHGGIIFCLADSAFAFACNSDNIRTVAAGARIEFLMPGNINDRLTAVAEQISQGKRTGVCDVVVKNQKGDTVALFRGNSHRLRGTVVEAES